MLMGAWRKNRELWELGCGPDLVLAVMKEKQTDLTVTNEPSPLPQLPVVFLSNSFLNPDLLPFYRPCSFFSLTVPYPTFPLSFSFSSSLPCSGGVRVLDVFASEEVLLHSIIRSL